MTNGARGIGICIVSVGANKNPRTPQSVGSYNNCITSGGGLGSLGLLVGSADGLGDEAVADRLGADLDADDSPVDDGANLLDVRAELSGGNPGDLRSHAAQVLGLAAMGD